MLYLNKRCTWINVVQNGVWDLWEQAFFQNLISTIPLLAREICRLLKKLRRSNTELKNVPKINSVINLSSRKVEFLIEIT